MAIKWDTYYNNESPYRKGDGSTVIEEQAETAMIIFGHYCEALGMENYHPVLRGHQAAFGIAGLRDFILNTVAPACDAAWYNLTEDEQEEEYLGGFDLMFVPEWMEENC